MQGHYVDLAGVRFIPQGREALQLAEAKAAVKCIGLLITQAKWQEIKMGSAAGGGPAPQEDAPWDDEEE